MRTAALAFAALLTSACASTEVADGFASQPDATVPTFDLGPVPDLGVDDAPRVYAVDAGAPADLAPLPEAGTTTGATGPFPIVLVHGFAGFRSIGPLTYFYQVPEDLRRRGETVYDPELPPFAPSSERAPVLAEAVRRAIAETGRPKVVLIAHSQGGLDARYLISTLGYGDRVAALVTVSTPHRGTRLGDAVSSLLPGVSDVVVNTLTTAFASVYNGAPGAAQLRASLVALSEGASADFNARNPDDPRVRYYSVAGRSNRRDGSAVCGDALVPNDPGARDNPNLLIAALMPFLEGTDPTHNVNDGLVTVRSARWGTFIGCVPADHFDEVGQIAEMGPNGESGFDHIALYRDLVHRVRADGF